MGFNVSLENTVVTINGHVCEGWADDDSALSFPNINLVNETTGPDGLLAVSSTGMRGGPMVLKFQANSASTKFFGTLLSRRLRGIPVQFSGTIVNTQTGVTTRLEGGVFKDAPLGQSLGSGTPNQQEFTIIFQVILTNRDAMVTQPAPVLAATEAEAA